MTRRDSGIDVEQLLARELRRNVGSVSGPSPTPSQAVYVAKRRRGFVTAKVTGLAVAGLPAFGASVVATAATGSRDPAVWESAVTHAVATCDGSLSPGQNGIGPCAGSLTSQSGRQHRIPRGPGSQRTRPGAGGPVTHPAPSSPASGQGHVTGRPSTLPPSGSSGLGHANGRPATLPPPASSAPGRSSGRPATRPLAPRPTPMPGLSRGGTGAAGPPASATRPRDPSGHPLAPSSGPRR